MRGADPPVWMRVVPIRLCGCVVRWPLAEAFPDGAQDDALSGRLADYVTSLAERVRTLERTVGGREERVATLEMECAQAAEELKRLVARRGAAQRRTAAAGMLTGERPPAAGHDSDAAGGEGGAPEGGAELAAAAAPGGRRGPAKPQARQQPRGRVRTKGNGAASAAAERAAEPTAAEPEAGVGVQ